MKKPFNHYHGDEAQASYWIDAPNPDSLDAIDSKYKRMMFFPRRAGKTYCVEKLSKNIINNYLKDDEKMIPVAPGISITNQFTGENKMAHLFLVVVTELPTKNESDNGAEEKIVVPLQAIMARDANAAIAIASEKLPDDVNKHRINVHVRNF